MKKKKESRWLKCSVCGMQCSVIFTGKDGKKRCFQCNTKKVSKSLRKIPRQ